MVSMGCSLYGAIRCKVFSVVSCCLVSINVPWKVFGATVTFDFFTTAKVNCHVIVRRICCDWFLSESKKQLSVTNASRHDSAASFYRDTIQVAKRNWSMTWPLVCWDCANNEDWLWGCLRHAWQRDEDVLSVTWAIASMSSVTCVTLMY